MWYTKEKGNGCIQLGFESKNAVEILRGNLIDRKRRASDRVGELAETLDLGGEGGTA